MCKRCSPDFSGFLLLQDIKINVVVQIWLWYDMVVVRDCILIYLICNIKSFKHLNYNPFWWRVILKKSFCMTQTDVLVYVVLLYIIATVWSPHVPWRRFLFSFGSRVLFSNISHMNQYPGIVVAESLWGWNRPFLAYLVKFWTVLKPPSPLHIGIFTSQICIDLRGGQNPCKRGGNGGIGGKKHCLIS